LDRRRYCRGVFIRFVFDWRWQNIFRCFGAFQGEKVTLPSVSVGWVASFESFSFEAQPTFQSNARTTNETTGVFFILNRLKVLFFARALVAWSLLQRVDPSVETFKTKRKLESHQKLVANDAELVWLAFRVCIVGPKCTNGVPATRDRHIN
jgi:hypothetical protein